MLAGQPWESLRPALLGNVDAGQALGQLKHYAQMLLEWNRSVSNIMSKNDEDRIVERHLLESVAPAYWLHESGVGRWIDFGSGAGFPAIPLAIAGVGGAWTLVESRRTKTLFVRKAIQDIGLSRIEVLNDRLETVVQDSVQPGEFDGFTSRATLRLGPTLVLASRLVREGGSAFLWKGSGLDEEIAQDSDWSADWEFAGKLVVGTGLNVVARFIRNKAD